MIGAYPHAQVFGTLKRGGSMTAAKVAQCTTLSRIEAEAYLDDLTSFGAVEAWWKCEGGDTLYRVAQKAKALPERLEDRPDGAITSRLTLASMMALAGDMRILEGKKCRREAEDRRLRTMRWVKGRRVYVDEGAE